MFVTLALTTALSIGNPIPVTPAEKEVVKEQLTSTNAQHVEALAAEKAPSARVIAAGEDDRGFFGTHFPFTLPDEMHPEVEENMVLLWIINIFFSGYAAQVWSPKLFLDDVDLGGDYMTEALIGWILHTAIEILPIFFFWVPFVGWFGVPIWLVVHTFYLWPVATINSINHHALQNDGGGGKRKRRKRSSMLELPGMQQAATAAY